LSRAVKIALIYNARAGSGVSSTTLRRDLEAAGHTLVDVLDKDGIGRALDADPELVVVAGGDGTVSRVACALAGHGVPLAVLPLGTANNIARTLGIDGSVEQLVARWARAHHLSLDVGVARGPWGERRFFEGAGGGLVSLGIAAMDRDPPPDGADPDERVRLAVRCYRDVLAHQAARRLELTVDGEPLRGEFLLVAVLNMRAVGANLVLAADADPTDGAFHLVTAGEEHRGELDAYLAMRREGRTCALHLPSRRAARLTVEGLDELHIDDEVHASPDLGRVELILEPGALELLA
jgi:diacylglycerol kinase (ATP)